MAEEIGTRNIPSMNWQATDLDREWARFKQHCEFTFNGPLAGKSEKEKVNYLMTFIGDKGREVYGTFTWNPAHGNTPAENDTLEGVYKKYADYVQPKRNEIRATVKFNRRRQEPNERFDEFVTAMRILVKDCGYDTLENRMLRDGIVLRSKHPAVMEKCFDKGEELTLDMAINIGRNYETSQESIRTVGVDEDQKVHVVKKFKKKPYDSRKKGQEESEEQTSETKGECRRCGYDSSHRNCPAIGLTCNYCKKPDQFAKKCLLRKAKAQTGAHVINEYEEYETSSSDEDGYAHLIHTVNQVGDERKDGWSEMLQIGDKKIKTQLDTGAAKSFMSVETYNSMEEKPPLRPTKSVYHSYTHHPIPVVGTVVFPVKWKRKWINVKFNVAEQDQSPLVSGAVCQELGLIQRVHKVVKPVVRAPRRQPYAYDAKVVSHHDAIRSYVVEPAGKN